MELNTKESGKMTYSMEKVLKHGQMDLVMKVTMHSAGNMVLAAISGMMDHNIQETGKRIRSLG